MHTAVSAKYVLASGVTNVDGARLGLELSAIPEALATNPVVPFSHVSGGQCIVFVRCVLGVCG